MLYASLAHVTFLISTAFFITRIRLDWLFATAFVLWALAWGLWLVMWHVAVSHPPAVSYVYLMMLAAMLIAWNLKYRKRTFLSCALGCAIVAYGMSMNDFRPIYHQHQQLLAQYPPTDLKPRLSYEQASVDRTAPQNGVLGSPQSAGPQRALKYDVDQLAKRQEAFGKFPNRFGYRGGDGEYRGMRRQRAFEALTRVHKGFIADFIAQPAMGWGRLPAMRPLSKYDLEMDDEGPNPDPDKLPPLHDQPPPNQEPEGSPKSELLDVAKNPPATQESIATASPSADLPNPLLLQKHHLDNVLNFAPPNSLGGVNTKLEARGFQSHAYRSPVESYEEQDAATVESQGWKLARLELVSLLKHKPAAVYVSEHLPAMDELRDAPTRPTTTFELNAVAKLREGQELITEPSPHGLRMVGAIRAIEQCRKCHQVPLGGLLGAFSYQFRSR